MLGPTFLPNGLSSIPFAGHALTTYPRWASIWEKTERKGSPGRKMALTVMKYNLEPRP